MRLIDADELENDICKVLRNRHSKRAILALYMMIDIIRGRDTIKANPVRHGKWINIGGKKYPVYSCSECDREQSAETPYCPFCGAKMDGGIKIEFENILAFSEYDYKEDTSGNSHDDYER